jgi:hypothetical protein
MASVLSLRYHPDRLDNPGRYTSSAQWRTTGTSGVWPKVINIWEHEGMGGLMLNLSRQFTDVQRDSEMEDWWNRNLHLRRGGYDRVLLPTAYSPTFSRLVRAGYRAPLFVQEIATVPWGQRDEYAARLGKEFVPDAQRYGWRLVGAYTVAMRPREVLTVFGLTGWPAFARLMDARARDRSLKQWFAYRDATVVKSEEMVLLPGRHDRLGSR